MPNLYNRLNTRYVHLHRSNSSQTFLSHLPNTTFAYFPLSLSSHPIHQTSMDTLPASTKQNSQEDEHLIPLDQNVLQKHVAFFDRNNDGIIYPWETFQGMRAIGCGVVLSVFAAIFINGGLSRKTRSGKFPSLLLAVEVKNIVRAKHGSDSGVYDREGRFVPSKFEEIFIKHARSHPNALTGDELMSMLRANREPKDYLGWLGSYSEWKMLYYLGKDKNGLLHKETLRGVYDGSLFEKMAKEHSEKKSK